MAFAASHPSFDGSRVPPPGAIRASAHASIIEISQSSAASIAQTFPPYVSPGASSSGQTKTLRPRSTLQSALSAAFAPPGAVTATDFGKISAAASADFSPSQMITGASGRPASLSKL